MADRFCRHCGLELASEGPYCSRCGTSKYGASIPRHFDGETGQPLDPIPSLRCWHCGKPIAQQQLICPRCGTPLTVRSGASIAYDVVPKTSALNANSTAPASRNYLVRHWRGEISLLVSFWVNVVLLNVATRIVLAQLNPALETIINPVLGFAVLVGSWVFSIALIIWQVMDLFFN